MKNKRKFINEAFWWFTGTIIGNGLSIAGICSDSKCISIIGITIATVATIYYAYRCWKELQWEEIE